MTTAVSASTTTYQRLVVPPTSGLDEDALLVKRPVLSDGWSRCMDALLEIRQLEDDWDGLGAPAPEVALVDSARSLAQIWRQDRVTPPCRVVAGLTGTVLFEWQGAGGEYLEVEVTCPHHAEWVKMIPGVPTASGQIRW